MTRRRPGPRPPGDAGRRRRHGGVTAASRRRPPSPAGQGIDCSGAADKFALSSVELRDDERRIRLFRSRRQVCVQLARMVARSQESTITGPMRPGLPPAVYSGLAKPGVARGDAKGVAKGEWRFATTGLTTGSASRRHWRRSRSSQNGSAAAAATTPRGTCGFDHLIASPWS